LLVPGTNLLAVEVHQASPGSSDISFDLQLFADQADPPRLGIRRAAGTLELLWPLAQPRCSLQWATSLKPQVVWWPFPLVPIETNAHCVVRVSGRSPEAFFRLVR
jgi:hypothetical protein